MYKYVTWPHISPLPDNANGPLWSVMIPTYNCASYLSETLKSILKQDPGVDMMQIEVVDDCSTKDSPEKIVHDIGGGRVEFFKQSANVGPPANFNTCIERSRGKLVHILHSDDTIKDGFYRHLSEAFEKKPAIGAAFCRSIFMDEKGQAHSFSPLEKKTQGIIPNWLERIAVMCWPQASSVVVKRSIYEKVGGFCTELIHCNDWDMWKRIALHYPVWFEPKPLACYRYLHTEAHTHRLVRSGENIRDSRKSIRISQTYLPKSIARKLSKKANENHAVYAFITACRMSLRGNTIAAKSQFREAYKCSHSPKTIIRIFLHIIWSILMNFKNRKLTSENI